MKNQSRSWDFPLTMKNLSKSWDVPLIFIGEVDLSLMYDSDDCRFEKGLKAYMIDIPGLKTTFYAPADFSPLQLQELAHSKIEVFRQAMSKTLPQPIYWYEKN